MRRGALSGVSTSVAIGALIASAVLAAAKFVAAGFSGSAALFAEAVHSTVDTGNQALLLIGFARADDADTGRVDLGGGRELHVWSHVAAVLLIGIGAGVAVSRGVDRLFEPLPLARTGLVYLVLLAALAFQIASWTHGVRRLGEAGAGRPLLGRLRQARDRAAAPLVFADTAGIAGLLVALAGVFLSDRLGWLRADGLAAIMVGAILAVAGILLVLETRVLMVGQAARPHLVEDIIGVAGRAPFVHGVNEVRTTRFGSSGTLVNLSVDARDDLPAAEVEIGIAALEAELRARHPEIGRVFIEIRSGEGPAVSV